MFSIGFWENKEKDKEQNQNRPCYFFLKPFNISGCFRRRRKTERGNLPLRSTCHASCYSGLYMSSHLIFPPIVRERCHHLHFLDHEI